MDELRECVQDCNAAAFSSQGFRVGCYTFSRFAARFSLAAANPTLKQRTGTLMRLPIRPGKLTCAGLVAIFMVLPNSIWKGPDAKDAPVSKLKLETMKIKKTARDSYRSRVKFQELAR